MVHLPYMRALLVAGALAVLAGCGGADPAATATPAPSPTPTRDDKAYLAQLRADLPGNFAFLPDGDLVELGLSTCSSIDRGVDRPTLGRAAESNVGPVVAKILLDAATEHLCPQHRDF